MGPEMETEKQIEMKMEEKKVKMETKVEREQTRELETEIEKQVERKVDTSNWHGSQLSVIIVLFLLIFVLLTKLPIWTLVLLSFTPLPHCHIFSGQHVEINNTQKLVALFQFLVS